MGGKMVVAHVGLYTALPHAKVTHTGVTRPTRLHAFCIACPHMQGILQAHLVMCLALALSHASTPTNLLC